MKIHESGEDYLEAIFVLQQKKGMVRSVDVAQHLGVKKPSVCNAVSILEQGGFLVAGVEAATAEQEACRIEHDISEQSFQKLKKWKELGHSEETNGN